MSGIKVPEGFNVRSASPVDTRFVLSKSEMRGMNDKLMPAKYFAICKEDGNFYLYDKTATASSLTGKFKLVESDLADRVAIIESDCVKNNDYQKFKAAIETRVLNTENKLVELETEIDGKAGRISLSLDSNYKLIAKLFAAVGGEAISESTVDLPIESAVTDAYFDSSSKSIVLVYQSGDTEEVLLNDLVSNLATKVELNDRTNAIEAKIPTKTSQLTNDSSFLTEHQSLAAYRTAIAQDAIDLTKQDKLLEGTNIKIEDNVISAYPQEYTAGNNVTISNYVINAQDTVYTAGENISIDENNVISASGGGSEPLRYLKEASANDKTLIITRKDGTTVEFTPKAATQTYTAGANVQISEDLVISATDTDTKYDKASVSADGLMSADDKFKLNNLENYDDTEVRNLIGTKASLIDLEEHEINAAVHTTTAEKAIWTNKQDKLTAGTNIVIDDNNVISTTAAGTAYAAGDNIQISATNVISATDTKYDDTEVRNLIGTKQNQITAENKLDYSLIANTPSIPAKVSELENDMEYIREGRLVNYPTGTELDAALALKQDNIEDLTDIRDGAALGLTAVQPADISDMATKTWVESKNYLTTHQDISNLATKTEVNAVENKIPTKTSQLTNDSGYLTEHQDLSAYAKKTEIPSTSGLATETYVNNKVAAVKVPTKVSELTNDKGYLTEHQDISGKQDKLTAGSNISIVDNVISAADAGGKLENELTTNITVGGITAGTTFAAGTKLEAILKQLLYQEVPSGVALYKGVVDSIPDSVSSLTAVPVERDDLLANGYVYKNITTDNQYAVLAIDKSAGLVCYQIEVSGFAMGFMTKDTGSQYLYYFENPTTESGIRYTYLFEEEE